MRIFMLCHCSRDDAGVQRSFIELRMYAILYVFNIKHLQ